MEESEARLAKLNQAAEAIGEDLLHAGFDRAAEYTSKFNIPKEDMALVLANAYFRVPMHANAVVFRLDAEELGKRVLQTIKDLAREASES